MGRVAVLGTGTTYFGRQPERSIEDMAWEASLEALEEADLRSVDAVFVATVNGPVGVAQRVCQGLGLSGIPVLTVANACASGTTAFHEAVAAVEHGRYERVLALGVESMSAVAGAIPPDPSNAEDRLGVVQPTYYAMMASRYMHDFGLSVQDLAAVAVKNKTNGANNPIAGFGQVVDAEGVLASRAISGPLTLLQCCAPSDGAAAVVVGAARAASVTPVTVQSSVLTSGSGWGPWSSHVPYFDMVRAAMAQAGERAGLGIEDVDVFEVHDAFTIGELVGIEALGLAAEGDAARRLREGDFDLGGRMPVNPSGGLLARGHPLGATGLAQVVEIADQLRGRSGPRQIVDARIGLVETRGGGVHGSEGSASVIAILSR